VEDFLKPIPELLERLTQKIRGMTVDPAVKVITIAAVVLIAGMMVSIALVFLFVGVFRILGDLVNGMERAYAIGGGLFLILGLLLWSKRHTKST
jgi:hypothetical protein